LTSALISHTIARLEFWRDMGILYIKENGNWEEVKEGPGSEVVVEGATAPEAASAPTAEGVPAPAATAAPTAEGAASP
jgi:hypothetical protein